ncbi:MAG: PQQ-dependent sugar dehydrogenase [Candidatus Sericytochromatia bacterium]
MLGPTDGGGQAEFAPPRRLIPEDVALPAGYRIEAIARELTFPTAITFDDAGRLYVVEAGYSYGPVTTTPRLLRIRSDGAHETIASGGNPPWNGVAHHRGAFYVAEGEHLGRLTRIAMDGTITPLVEDLPSFGDHHTNGPVLGPDGWLYFAQGTATNSGVVGVDNWKFGWLERYPRFHDVPGADITLRGHNFESENPLTEDPRDRAVTGAYMPFGTPSTPGQVVKGQVKATGSILRVKPEGGKVEQVAWGLRNPFGLAFAPDGRLYVTENGFDIRGSRPVFGSADFLWKITPGTWYGWPDFVGGHPIEDHRYKAPGKPQPRFLLAEHPNAPPKPTAALGVHSSSNGLDFSRSAAFGHVGKAFIAQFGDMVPEVGKVLSPVGFKVIMVDPETGVVEDFAVNRGSVNGPASKLGSGGLERPVSARFGLKGEALYVVDFGVMTMGPKGPEPRAKTGVIWRITREGRS